MPGFNSTGPEGQGPRTGRMLGKCKPRTDSEPATSLSPLKDADETGKDNFPGRGMGRGRGHGKGRGMGRGRGFGQGRGLR